MLLRASGVGPGAEHPLAEEPSLAGRVLKTAPQPVPAWRWWRLTRGGEGGGRRFDWAIRGSIPAKMTDRMPIVDRCRLLAIHTSPTTPDGDLTATSTPDRNTAGFYVPFIEH